MQNNTLPHDVEQLKLLVQSWQEKYFNLLEQFKLAKLRQYASSSEKNVLQGDLFDEVDQALPEEVKDEIDDSITVTYHRKKHPTRQALPAHFPREEICCDVEEVEKVCACGRHKEKFGEEITEQLDVIPPQLKVLRYVRPKYACKSCQENVSIAALPDLLLPKSIAAPGLVAYTITSKYVDHLPLYRQKQIWQRYGIHIPRNSSCGWLMKTGELCEPLYLLLCHHIVQQIYCQADETPLQVLKEPGRDNKKQSYMWVYRAGHLTNKLAVVFDYQETRSGLHARHFLKDFKGYLQTDGYKGYDWVDDDPAIVHLACMVHARRPFAELVKIAKQAGKAHEAVSLIKKLYDVEQEARERGLSYEARKTLRLEKAVPVLDKIKVWLEKSVRGSPPKGKLGQAINYMLERWGALTNYLKEGYLEIDNNRIENDIRPLALGKNNWIFAGSPRGAHAGAIFYSLIATCKANGIDPFAYFHYLLNHLRACRDEADYRALLPFNIDPALLLKR